MDRVSTQRLGEGVFKDPMYHHVYADSKERYTNSYGSRRPIRYGDRLFARIVMRGRTIVEFVLDRVSDMTQLLGEVRKKVKGIRGLARVYVRNYSQGWSLEQPLMLYAPRPAYQTQTQLSAPAQPAPAAPAPARKMLFPWETH